MFKLRENNYVKNRSCSYIDEFGNKAFLKRNEKEIVAKLRFSEKRVIAEPMYIAFPVEEGKDGDPLKLKYPQGFDISREDVAGGIENLTLLINRWINMQYDLALLETGNDLFRSANPGKSDEEISQHKLAALEQYEEFVPVLRAM